MTFYFGLLALGLAALLGWLKWAYKWDIDFQQFYLWASRNAEILLIGVTFLLSLTLIASAIAYRQTCKMSQEDYYLWLQQRATRTLFPFFTPIHDWLRLHVRLYRWWHTQVYSTTLHVLLFLFFLVLSASSVRTIYSPAPGDPGCTGDEPPITISSNTTWSGNNCYDTITINNNATLTLNGGASVQANSLTLGTGAIPPVNGHITFKYDTLNNLGVSIKILGGVTVNSGSTIKGNGQGYAGGTAGSVNGAGTGGGLGNVGGNSGGGGYGGAGGTVGSATGGATYGSDTAPDVAGSGGGYVSVSGAASNGGAGGAALKIESTGTFTFNGSINADGTVSVPASGIGSGKGGGGSGGSVWMIADTFTGTGTVTANGANGGSNGGGGGGGRIVRRYTSAIGTGLTLSATKGSGGTGGADGTIKNIGPVTTYDVAVPVGGSTTKTAGTSFSLVITAKDSLGATYPTYNGTVTFTSNDTQAIMPSNYTFVAGDNGIKTVSGFTLKTAGTKTITVTEVGNSTVIGTINLTVIAGTATNLTVTGITSTVSAGNAVSPTVTIFDQYGNVATTFTGVVSFSSNDAQATLPANYTFGNPDQGVKVFTNQFVVKTAGTRTLTATATSSSSPGLSSTFQGSHSNFTVVPNTATQIILTNINDSVLAGEKLTPIVTMKDAYGNVATGYTGTVRFTATDTSAVLPGDYTYVANDAGIKTFTNLLEFRTLGSITLTIAEIGGSSGGIISSERSLSTKLTLTVNPGAHSTYSLTTTSPQKVGVGWQETVTPKDAFGNTVTISEKTVITPTASGSVKFYTSNTYLTETSEYVMATQSLTIYLKATAAGTTTITVNDGTRQATSGSIKINPADTATETPPVTGTTEETPPTTAPPVTTPTVSTPQATSQPSTGITRVFETIQETVENNQALVNAANTAAVAVSPVATVVALGPLSTALVTAIIDTFVKGASFLGGFFGVTPTRLRGRRWGIVRNRRSGMPIGGVFIELLDATGEAIDRVLTDRTGHYAFLVDKPGRYWIQVRNPLYERFLSRPLTVNNPADDLINEDITLELIEEKLKSRMMMVGWLFGLMRVLNFIHWPLLIFGSVLAVYIYSIDQTLLKALVVSLYVLLWGTKVLELDYKRPFGVVVDAQTGKPQPSSVVQIVQRSKNEGPASVRSTITDHAGRFLFVIKPGRYHLIAGKEGYEPVEMEIQGDTVNLTIKLKQDKR
ncbi:MAG: carboxypeptidase regulatory-like domain-containing protein [Candidatus Berkelbacteria bacterium]|nr:MAG: carboxypeptidase regulatory-like domain-containing protein [Candidatus Berkelbacteria bacterium]QQG51975.1 MAG: carboxypeptidase regulatory-like domain-containing protein [Candidatus Berkelbacteria bacterium]